MLQKKYKPKSWLITQNEDGTYKLETKMMVLDTDNNEDVEVELIMPRVDIGFESYMAVPIPQGYTVLTDATGTSLFEFKI